MARIKGNTAPLLSFKVGSAAVVDLGADVVSVAFVDGEGSPLTMADFASGATPKAMNVTWALDFAATSAFDFHWTNAGASNVTYVFQVNSGTVSQTNPKFTGTLTMGNKPNFAVEAGTDEQTFEAEYQLDTYNKVIS